MKKLSKKMMISLLTFALVFIALGVSTFAWFTLADSASLNDLEINVSLGEGLDISLDGTNYQSNLTKEDIARKIGNIKLTDCTSTDGISIKDIKGGSVTDYISLTIYFRAAGINDTKAATNGVGIYLSDYNDEAVYNEESEQKGTFVVSDGVTLNPSTAYRANANDQTLTSTALEYFAANAIRVSFVQNGTLTAFYDFNSEEGRNYNDGFLTTANSKDAEGLYGAASYYYAKQNTNIGKGTALPEGIINDHNSFTEFEHEDSAKVAKSNSSLICNLTKGNSQIIGQEEIYYYGSVTINIWLEGWDTDCFNVILKDFVMAQFHFVLGYKHIEENQE